jgi:hypothetical protein
MTPRFCAQSGCAQAGTKSVKGSILKNAVHLNYFQATRPNASNFESGHP